ncbi:fungal hydrophobin [Vararia minispora EC-137]|uniref:Fungal hydrophobin n=1 Tax=Vararia minispora EC-137 TaxID=1314806 RepID=A0ACB8QP70_9AGAM|nr:fungal hydrophobin [Vararia minispora EC-137]
MFARLSVVALLAAALAIAAPQTSTSCNSGSTQCCNSIQPASSQQAADLLSLIGVNLQGLNIPIGIDCTPINVLGIGSNSCQQQVACCQGGTSGTIGLGCVPIGIAAL